MQVRRVREFEVAVDRDRVVQRVHERPAVAHEVEHAGAQALVVVDEVELRTPIGQPLVDAAAERVRLGEPGRAHDPEFLQIGEGAELVRPRHAEGVVAAVQVEARYLFEGDRRVGDRPRLAREHRHGVAELGQLSGQMAAIDTLAPAVRISSVDAEGDPQRIAGSGGCSGGRHEGPRMVWDRGPSQTLWCYSRVARERAAISLGR